MVFCFSSLYGGGELGSVCELGNGCGVSQYMVCTAAPCQVGRAGFFAYLFVLDVLDLSCGLQGVCCGMQDLLLQHMGSSSLTRD